MLYVMLCTALRTILNGVVHDIKTCIFCCCRYEGSTKHIRIQHSDDGSYYLASCHVFPTVAVCVATSGSVRLPSLLY